ncbi:MAG: hypothetical protein AAF744_00220 [Pseudomonadota bacterium]
MAHPDTWSFLAKLQKAKPQSTPQTKDTPQNATKAKPTEPPVFTDYASI